MTLQDLGQSANLALEGHRRIAGRAAQSHPRGTVVSATIPIFIVLFAAIRLKQAVTPLQKAGIAAAFAGIAIVALGRGGGVEASPEGVGFLLLSAVAIGFYYVWSVELTLAQPSFNLNKKDYTKDSFSYIPPGGVT
ncbi:hypothetical protein ACQ858_01360 [Variovorax ureilyticus]|uniref:hypothetical protein n=1 Tax=Variovorax ureilyticus TaxID=1836198 RepID=UPI003D66D6B4